MVVAVVMVFMALGVVFAASDVYQNGSKVGIVQGTSYQNGPAVTSTGSIAIVDFATMTGNQSITGDVDITGDLSVSGIIVDPALYTAAAGTGGSKSLRISVDGTIYAY